MGPNVSTANPSVVSSTRVPGSQAAASPTWQPPPRFAASAPQEARRGEPSLVGSHKNKLGSSPSAAQAGQPNTVLCPGSFQGWTEMNALGEVKPEMMLRSPFHSRLRMRPRETSSRPTFSRLPLLVCSREESSEKASPKERLGPPDCAGSVHRGAIFGARGLGTLGPAASLLRSAFWCQGDASRAPRPLAAKS